MTQLNVWTRNLNETKLTCREPQRCPEVQQVLLLEKYGLNYMPSAASDEQTPRPARLQGMPLILILRTATMCLSIFLRETGELSFREVNQSFSFSIFLIEHQTTFFFPFEFSLYLISGLVFFRWRTKSWNNASSDSRRVGVGRYGPGRVGTAQ